MLNINDTPINKTQNKFLSLRKDLKNEIFEFLEYKEIIVSIRFLNKDNYTFFNNKKIFYYILTNIKTFVEEIGFEEDKLNLIKIKLSISKLSITYRLQWKYLIVQLIQRSSQSRQFILVFKYHRSDYIGLLP